MKIIITKKNILKYKCVTCLLFLVTDFRNGQIHCLEILLRHGAACTPSKDGLHPLDMCIKAGVSVCCPIAVISDTAEKPV